jgi:hypothetical protein
MDETTLGIIYLAAIAISVAVLIGFYNLCVNVSSIRKFLEAKKTEN